MKMMFFIIVITIGISSNAQAYIHNCLVSRNGNEFWLSHDQNQTCKTTLVLKNAVGSKNMEFVFDTTKQDPGGRLAPTQIYIRIDNQEFANFTIYGRVTMQLGEKLFFDCTNSETFPVIEGCVGLRSYPNNPNHKPEGPIQNINGLVEEIP